jgi:predicted metal-dependent enzyme (double-stranded beta helix superfamily)
MNVKTVLLIVLPLITSQILANELEAIQAQQEELKREIDSLHQTTSDEQARLEELQRLIGEQHKMNKLLDEQLKAERLRQQQQQE